MRAHLSYSDRHFKPGYDLGSDHRSVTQIAGHVWDVLQAHGFRLSYGDAVPDEPLDLLVTQTPTELRRRPGRLIYIQAGAHPLVTDQRIRAAFHAAKRLFPGLDPSRRELRARPDIWREHAMIVRADRTVLIGNAATHASYLEALEIGASRVFPLSYGIDTSVFRSFGSRPQPGVFVFPATRFCLRKGAHLVADAWRSFSPRHPEARLILLGRPGDFNLRSALDGLHGVEWYGEYVAGSQDHVELLNRADWVIFPSLAEGQAGSLMEALACGCVPLATDESGFDVERYGGWKLNASVPGNLLASMETAMRTDPQPARSRCLAAVADEHNWERFSKNFGRHVAEALETSPSGIAPGLVDWLRFTGKYCLPTRR